MVTNEYRAQKIVVSDLDRALMTGSAGVGLMKQGRS